MMKILMKKIAVQLMISYLLVCIVPVIIICTIIYKTSVKSLEETALEFASVFNSQIISEMDEFIDEYDKITKSVLVDNDIIMQMTKSISSDVSEQMNQQLEMRKIMLRLKTLKPEISTVCLVTRDKKIFQYSSLGEEIDYEILMNQEWMEALWNGEENIEISAVHDCSYYDRNQEQIVFTVGRKIYNQGGSYVGMILIDLNPASLITLSEGFLLARNQYNIKISISNKNNGILYDSDIASGRVNWSEAFEDNILFHEKNEEDYIVLGSETKRAGLHVNAVIPKSDLLFQIRHIKYVTGIVVMVSLLVVVIASGLFSQTITQPIRQLRDSMHRMENGEYQLLETGKNSEEINSLIGSYNHMILQIKKLIEDVYIQEIKQKNAQYLALRAQINPHMLYNTLESIRMKAMRGGAHDVAEMVKLLAKIFRRAFAAEITIHRLEEELEHVQDYVLLQNHRHRNMFILQIEVEEQVRKSGTISMLLQPIIENCVEHGFQGYNRPLSISIRGKITEKGDILLRICDDGNGMSLEKMNKINQCLVSGIFYMEEVNQEEEKQRASIGLRNISERIKLQYGEKYYLKLYENEKCGIGVEILIPQIMVKDNAKE